MMRELETGYNPEDPEAAEQEVAKLIPMGRYAESEEIANLVLFLASDESAFISGSQYRIDGGMAAKQFLSYEYHNPHSFGSEGFLMYTRFNNLSI